MTEDFLAYAARLVCHPITDNPAVQEVAVCIGWGHDEALALTYTLIGDCRRLRIPSARPQTQIDGLWKHTCFEMFVSAKDSVTYWEFNFAPSSEWAVYQFRSYRDRVPDKEILAVPKIFTGEIEGRFELNVRLHLPHLLMMQPLRLALSAVIEDDRGKLSYWALTHPSAKPDFHHPSSFVLEIAPPQKALTGKGV